MVYDLLYHNFFGSFLFLSYSVCFLYFGDVLKNTIIPGAHLWYEMVLAKLALRASLAIYNLISNVYPWNNS